VRQIGTAYSMCLQDYDEHFPPHVTERTAPAGTPDTPEARAPFSDRTKLAPYIKSDRIFKSPSASAWPDPAPGKWFTTTSGPAWSRPGGRTPAMTGGAIRRRHSLDPYRK
jgi:hypothetical protein